MFALFAHIILHILTNQDHLSEKQKQGGVYIGGGALNGKKYGKYLKS